MADTFAGFGPGDIAAYFGVSQPAARGIINLGNGASVATLPADQIKALQGVDPNRFKPGATSYNQGFGDITWGLQHLSEHTAGSHYHGDINIGSLLANVATAGLYGVAKAGFNIVTGGKVLKNVADAFAVTGPAGSVLQPTIGTKKTLIAEATVAGAALAAAPSEMLPFGGASALGPAAGVVGGFLLNTGKAVFSTLVNSIGAPSSDVRGASPGAPVMPTVASQPGVNYVYVGESTLGSGSGAGSGSGSDGQGAVTLPSPVSSSWFPVLVLGGALALFVVVRRLHHA